MSFLVALASDTQLEAMPNPHIKTYSVNEALEAGVEVPQSMLMDYELDRDEPDAIMWSDIQPEIDIEKGIFNLPDPDDNFDIWPMDCADELRSEKAFLAAVEWSRCTPARAEMLLDYIRRHLEKAEELELWHIWMGVNGEEYPLLVKTEDRQLAALSAEDICRFCERDVFNSCFNNVDVTKQYCMLIKR